MPAPGRQVATGRIARLGPVMDAGGAGARVSRRYDSPVRRERAARTRESILRAGADLVRHLSTWDWRTLTVRAVARKAGVHERTVYRHFPSEQDLRDALVQYLEAESGVSVEGLELDGVEGYVEQLFRYLSSLSRAGAPRQDPALAAIDQRRREAVLAAVARAAPDWPAADHRLAAALVDVLWSVPSYRRLTGGWDLDTEDASRGVVWVAGLIAAAVREGRRPSATG